MAISPKPEKAATSSDWRQVASDEYRRPLFANEIFLAVKSLFDGTCTMVSSLTIKGASISTVQDAWKQFPLLMPLVSMQLHRRRSNEKDEMEFLYKVPGDTSAVLQDWHKRTFRTYVELDRHHLQEQAILRRNELRPTEESDTSDVAHLYVSEDGSGVHLVFSFQHAVTDARGQWMMIDLFLKLCSGELDIDKSVYRWGIDDVKQLPRPFHYAAGLREDGDALPFDALEMIHKHIEQDTHLVPFAGFPSTPSSKPSTAVGSKVASIRYLVIPADDYKLLHSTAKANGCTASAWFGAVLTLLLFDLNNVPDYKTIRFPLQPVDARRHMPAGSPHYYGVAIGGGNVDMKDLSTMKAAAADLKQGGPIPATFWSVAKEYKEGLEKLMDDKDSILAAKEVLAIICPFVLADPKIGDMSSVFYTSLGRAKTYFKSSYGDSAKASTLVLTDLVTFPLFHNTLLTMCSLMEFQGELRINYQIPTNTYQETFAVNFAERLQSLVRQLVEGARMTNG